MKIKETLDLRELMIDAHAHFFFLKGEKVDRVRLWQILPTSIVIDKPKGAPMRKTILGYVPTIDGAAVYEIEGSVETDELPDQMPNTIRVGISSEGVKKLNRRQYPRANFTPPLEAWLLPQGRREKIPAKIINLSAGGLRVEMESRLSPKDTYTFKFKIETEDETHEMELEGMVLYEIPLENGFSYGIRFGARPVAISAEVSEASVDDLDQTVDLLGLVNKLLVKEF